MIFKRSEKNKIGLVLAGGGAKGLAHIGVLKQLEKAQIPIDYIMGVSMGAIIGAMYAWYKDADRLQQIVIDYINSDPFKKVKFPNVEDPAITESFWDQFTKKLKTTVVINMAAYTISIEDNDHLVNAVHSFLDPIDTFDQLKIPFSCVSADLIEGKSSIHSEGDLKKAVVASASIPGFLPPVKNNRQLLVDGAVVNNIPTNYMRELYQPQMVIASAFPTMIEKNEKYDSIYDVAIRSATINYQQYQNLLLKDADVVVTSRVEKFGWQEFDKVNELIRAGEAAAKEQLPQINNIVWNKKGLKGRLKQILRISV